MNREPERIFKGLTEEQKQAVLETEGQILVIAGAGTGKTRVLTHRIAYLLYLGIPEDNILALTFTNKAAEEMRERVALFLGKRPEKLFMGTFHSFAARILRVEAEKLGYSPDFSIYDRDDQKSLMKRVLENHNKSKSKAGQWIALISDLKRGAKIEVDPEKELIIKAYQKELKANNAMDFDDLLLNLYNLLKNFPEVHEKYAKRFRYIHVDEFQDTNQLQFKILLELSSVHGNLFVVGDEDQSIYGFRGADIKNILDFKKHFPEAKILRLQKNFRSTGNILKAASVLISKNRYRIGKTLWTDKPAGEKLKIYSFENEREEANFIGKMILNSGRPFSHYLILFRTNFQSRVFEEIFPLLGIPYEVVGIIRFYERKEIKDLLAFLKFAVNPRDFYSFARIVNLPPRGIGPKTVERIRNIALSKGISYLEAAEALMENAGEKLKKGLFEFLEIIAGIISRQDSAYKALKGLVEETGYIDMLRRTEEEIQAETRIENIEILLETVKKKEETRGGLSIEEYIQEAPLKSEIDDWEGPDRDNVTLMTVHTAKGLEFPVVIITGLEEGIFPHKSSFGNEFELEEERRLLHVAITRAKEEVYLTYAASRIMRHGEALKPSRFLAELPGDVIEYGMENQRIFEKSKEENKIKPGDHVYHSLFGMGKVLKIYDGKADVIFKTAGFKTLKLEYANLKKLA